MENIDNLDPKFTNAPDPVADPAAPGTPRRTRTMSPAALAANRANAQKSTGPRTPAGKARSASNSFRHGLYRLDYYSQYATSHDLSLAVAHNYLEQFNPVTPLEHSLVHKLVSLELRFLQMETAYAAFLMEFEKGNEPKSLPLVLRELDRIPLRILKITAQLRAEIALRLDQAEANGQEDIEDFPVLPPPAVPFAPATSAKGAIPNPNLTSPFLYKFVYDFTLNYGRKQPPANETQETNPNPSSTDPPAGS